MKAGFLQNIKKTVSILLLAAFALSAMPSGLHVHAEAEHVQSVTGHVHDYESEVPESSTKSEDGFCRTNYISKVISILGDSISTFAGYIPTADGYNLEHLARYPQDDLLTDVNETWWMQLISALGARLGINDSWRGATVSGAHPVTTGATGEDAAMFNLQRIKNLGANGTPDIIVFYGGTNDYAHVAALGSFDPLSAPMEPDFSAVKYDNLADGYVETLLRLKYFYPDALVIAVLPGVTASYYTTEKLAAGNAVLKQICDHYSVPYVDLYESALTAGMLPDGIHPGAEGMDVITGALLDLIGTLPAITGARTVYPVTHVLTNAKASLSYYKGVSEGAAFTENVTGKDLAVTVIMGGTDITAGCYADGVISIPAVTAELQITVTGTLDVLSGHLSALPAQVCAGVNLWSVLPHDPQYYSPNQGWGYTTVAAPSVTFEIQPGEKIYATSFGKIGENGSSKHSGIRVTFFSDSGVLVSLDPSQVYSEFEQNGFIIAPDGAKYVNVPMWGDNAEWELYLLGRSHDFGGEAYGVCSICGKGLIAMLYDDRLDVSDKEISIISAGTPTSYKVGYGVEENTPDEAVVRLENGKLIACGIGEAAVMIDGVIYTVNVTPAPISLLLLIGQSNMRGSEGNANQSIVCPEGQVYATYGDDRGASNTEFTVSTARYFAPSALAGEYSTVNVEGTTECLSGYPLYTLCEEGAGKIGPDSGFAYEWVKATGEKVWVVNAAHGGTSITAWQKGGKEYNEALLLFTACRQTLQKEIAAGHYTLSHTGYFWCQGCSDASQTAAWYINKFTAMHENLKADNTFDHDLDPSTPDITFEFAGIIPILHGLNSYRAGVYSDPLVGAHYESCRTLTFNGPRAAQYIMCSDPGLPDVYMVCDIGSGWVRMPDGSSGVAAYFASHYENGTVDYQTQVPQASSWYKPTTPAAVHDSIHYNQIGYNEVGIESAKNMLILLGVLPDTDDQTTVKFVNWTGYEEVTEIKASKTASSETLAVPIVSPCYRSKQVTYTVSEGLSYQFYDLTAAFTDVSGTLTAHGAEGSVSVVPREYGTFRFETDKNDFISVGETENKTVFLSGSLNSGVFNNARIALTDGIILDHDQSWIIEIKMTGPWYSSEMPKLKKLLSADGAATSVGAYSLMVSGNTDRIWIGYYNGTTHVGCGVCLAEYGISVSDTHIYRLYNQVNEDGSNVVLLYVDGQYVAPVTRYITGADGDTGTESQMLNGADLRFGCLGAVNYPLDSGSIEYLYIIEFEASAETHIHDFSPWETVALPSAEGPGTDRRVCSICGLAEEREIEGVWQKYSLSAHLQDMPEYCCETNLWTELEHDRYYFASGTNWGIHSSGSVYSVTIPVKPGDMIYASSFGKAGENGHAASDGIRTTFFDIYGILKTYEPSQVYDEFNKNGGYIVAPEGSAFINIAMWTDSDNWEIYILNAPHIYIDTVTQPTYARGGYTTHTCLCCGGSYVDTYTDKLVHDALEDGEFKLLLIGNSYSEDASNCGQGMKDSQLLNILQSMLGEDVNITIGLCYSGGKSMAWHSTQAERGARSYSLRIISSDQPAWRSLGSVTSAQALEYTDWDVVTLQPYSTEAFTGTAKPIYPDGEDEKFYPMEVSNPYMLDHAATHAPQADVYCYMHWAATSSMSINAGLSYYNTQANFFPTVLTYEGTESGRRYEDIIPVSLSVQNARTTYLAKLRYNTTAHADGNLNLYTDAQIGLQRDGGHLSFNIGRYIAALTFAEIIIPVNIRVDGYSLPDIRITESVGKLPLEYSVIAQLSVFAAVDSWKNKNDLADVTKIDGYQTDPIELAANYNNASYEIKCAADEDEAKATIAAAVGAVLPDEYRVHEIMLPEDAQFTFGGSFGCEVSIRFGYSFKTVSVTVSVTQHDYKDTVTAPTCTEQGYTTHTCACGDTYTDSFIDALGHDYVSTLTEPTCTETGYTTHVCSRCNDTYVDGHTDALGHDYVSTVTEPTCTEDGFTTHICSRCGDNYVDGHKDALGHDYVSTVTGPTCTEDGFTTHVCSRCGDNYVDGHKDALGHSYKEHKGEDGLIRHVCERCGIQKEFLPGDYNGDGVINGLDLILLRKYLAAYDFETGKCSVGILISADLDGDGAITGLDLIRLRKYLSGVVTS